jgi:hypothetical protein
MTTVALLLGNRSMRQASTMLPLGDKKNINRPKGNIYDRIVKINKQIHYFNTV